MSILLTPFKHTVSVLLVVLCLVSLSVQAQTIRYVKPTATGTGDGLTWANASGNLQAMIQASAANDEVWVAAGTYKPTKKPYNNGVEVTTTSNRDRTFHVKDGVKIYGGFDGTETTLTARNITTNITLLSGDIGTAGVDTDNCYHVVLASAPSSGGIGVTIDGFSITGGNANISNSLWINGNDIHRSVAGGIFTFNGTNTLSGNTLYNNTASFGGGIYTRFGMNTVSNNTLYSNTAISNGGGIIITDGTNTVSNNTLYNNTAMTSCGGIFITDGTNTVSNNTLYNNTATGIGGGILVQYGTNTLSNNTLYNNTAGDFGGGVFTVSSTNTLSNNIFWGNKKAIDATVAGADYYADSANNTFQNNLLQLASTNYSNANSNSLGSSASGNIFATDPLFVNAADPNGSDNIHRTADDGLALQASSPAINAGISGVGIPTVDILGATRTGNPDMGAYEYQCVAFVPVITQSGNTLSTTGTGTYQWSLSGTAINGATSSTYNPTQDGTYSVVVVDANGCTSSSSDFDYSTIGVEQLNKKDLILYPNPTTGMIYFSQFHLMNIEVFAVDGRLVQTATNVSQLDMSALVSGAYFVRCNIDNEIVTFRVVKD